MKYTVFAITLCTLLLTFTSCSDEVDTPTNGGKDCVFEQNDEDMDGLIDDTERTLMDECRSNAFEDKDKIVENLIGEWELIGHGEGWIPSISQPCGYVTFTSNEYTFTYQDTHKDTTITSTWDIKVSDGTNGSSFVFDFESDFAYPLRAGSFCPKYFFSDATPVDGNMYLWAKVE